MKFNLRAKSRPASLVIPCLLGLESVVGDELRSLGFPREDIRRENGQVFIDLDRSGSPEVWGERFNRVLYRVNLGLASAERVQVELGATPCENFDALYAYVRSLPWEEYIVKDWFIHLSGWSRQSKIFGISAVQSIAKRAIMDRLRERYELPSDAVIRENPERGIVRIQAVFRDDVLSLRLDSSGPGLHKRGYRLEQGGAPIKETLAAALIHLSLWPRRRGEGLYDPFCGSGTFLIEAARAVRGTAPGALRGFRFESWPGNRPELRSDYLSIPVHEEAGPLLGSDIDAEALRIAKRNAERAGVADCIRFFQADIRKESFHAIPEMDDERPMLILCNPPYGERMKDPIVAVHRALRRQVFDRRGLLPRRRLTVITAAPDFEETIGYQADKRRKLYNGMILSPMYHYHRAGRTKVYDRRRR